MPRTALVPIHLDGLFVPAGQSAEVAAPMVDFTKLDDPTLPYLGSSLSALPLSTVKLEAGVHLHWALPDALTKTMGLPLVRRQSFRNIFGQDGSNTVWQALQTAGWIKPLQGQPHTAKVLKSRKERRPAPANILPEQLDAVQQILDAHTFPAVPNRWLITRLTADGLTADKQWILESDYVWPNNDPAKNGRYTAFPKADKDRMDYCYLGRWHELDTTTTTTPASGDSYLPAPLTAVGYGEPSFAAFYPNCRSVFGFCDETPPDQATTYEVLGWYHDSTQDYFASFIAHFKENLPAKYPYAQLLAALKEEFHWFLPIELHKEDLQLSIDNKDWLAFIGEKGWLENPGPDTATLSMAALNAANTLGAGNEAVEDTIRAKLETIIQQQLPAQTLCYARCVAGKDAPAQPAAADSITLAIGNTNTEAVSALLAQQLSSANKAVVEDYLEALQLEPQLRHLQVDLGPKFEEARHEKSFHAAHGGTIWSVRPQKADVQKADVSEAEEASLPQELGDMLNELNILQQQYDQTNFQAASLQQQIFADWCRYLHKEYDLKNAEKPDPFSSENTQGFTDPSDSGFGDENNETVPTNDQDTLDKMRGFIEWEIDTVLKKLQQSAMDLSQKIDAQHKALTACLAGLPSKTPYALQPIAAPRYWQPAEPTILISGIQPSPRHGQDGRLRPDKLLSCRVWENGTLPLDKSNYSAIATELAAIAQAEPDNFGLHPSTAKDWHPLFMDWDIAYFQAKNNYQGNPDEYRYIGQYLDQYQLNAVSFLNAPKAVATDQPIPFSARSILTPSGSLLQKDVIIRNLIPDILEALKSALKPAPLSINGLKKLNGLNDPALAELLAKPADANTDEGQQISACLSARLANGADGLPGIVDWYWTQIVKQNTGIPGLAANIDLAAFIPWIIPRAKQKKDRELLANVLEYVAYDRLRTVQGLSQAMGGFNKSLLTLAQSYQLDIANPAASDETAKAFAAKVRGAVQLHSSYSPRQDASFSPIRAGKMTLDRVHLVNNFGQYWPPTGQNLADTANLVCTEGMAWAKGAKDIALPPRLLDLARLNFRWLSARAAQTNGQDLEEMNSHPATSPICGWLLPNNLDDSLMVYGQDGTAVGYIDQAGRWRVFPGHDGPILPQEISNPHLRTVVERLCRQGQGLPGFIPDFIAVLDTALDSIAPDNSAQHDALALLMGRPLALVRAAISLECRGGVSVNQSERVFLEDLGRFADAQKAGQADAFQRNTFGVEQVKVPLRLGEFRQLNDGLAGYWIDAAPADALPQGAVPDTFFAPQSFDPKKNKQPQQIMTHDENGAAFQLKLNLGMQKPIEVSMLIDPRGKVHATCGLLPVKNIYLPPDQYRRALDQIEIAFLSTPILTLPGCLHLSLPREPGYGWSWVEKDGQSWKTVNSAGAIRPADVERAFPGQGAAVWALLKANGWIEETAAGSVRVVPKDQRSSPGLGAAGQAIEPLVEEMLEWLKISPFDATAAFSGTPEIREGWLKLTKINTNSQ